jgi:hypothetical protein
MGKLGRFSDFDYNLHNLVKMGSDDCSVSLRRNLQNGSFSLRERGDLGDHAGD